MISVCISGVGCTVPRPPMPSSAPRLHVGAMGVALARASAVSLSADGGRGREDMAPGWISCALSQSEFRLAVLLRVAWLSLVTVILQTCSLLELTDRPSLPRSLPAPSHESWLPCMSAPCRCLDALCPSSLCGYLGVGCDTSLCHAQWGIACSHCSLLREALRCLQGIRDRDVDCHIVVLCDKRI